MKDRPDGAVPTGCPICGEQDHRFSRCPKNVKNMTPQELEEFLKK